MAARLKPLTPELTAIHTFGAELRRLRIRAGMSQPQLASALYTSKSTVSRAETGVRLLARDLAEACDTLMQADGLLISVWDTAARTDTNGGSSAPSSSVPAARAQGGTLAREAGSHQHVAPHKRAQVPLPTGHWRTESRTYPFSRLRYFVTRNDGIERVALPLDRPGLSGRSSAGASPPSIPLIGPRARGSSGLSASWRRRLFRESISVHGDVHGADSDGADSVACRANVSRSPPCADPGRPSESGALRTSDRAPSHRIHLSVLPIQSPGIDHG
ncbi:helix-turn-helix domain-containing protein [Actinospica robiniae]|uniref:helix-turn-helix transcriptional regulator n=1 Tax=Actinospica robiniae TaxID=304901 RepID=UPI0009FC2755